MKLYNNKVNFSVSNSNNVRMATAPNVSYRGNAYDYEDDTVDFSTQEEKKSNAGKIALALLGAAILTVGGIAFHKGRPAEGETKAFGQRMKDGFSEIWSSFKGLLGKKD